jgi:hypothetical protein
MPRSDPADEMFTNHLPYQVNLQLQMTSKGFYAQGFFGGDEHLCGGAINVEVNIKKRQKVT